MQERNIFLWNNEELNEAVVPLEGAFQVTECAVELEDTLERLVVRLYTARVAFEQVSESILNYPLPTPRAAEQLGARNYPRLKRFEGASANRSRGTKHQSLRYTASRRTTRKWKSHGTMQREHPTAA